MTRIRTGNARRRARARRALGGEVIQSWECHVDDYDGRRVHLTMRDVTAKHGEEQELGIFPRRLFSHVPLCRGLILIVDVLRCRQISIRTVPRDPDAPHQLGELVKLLEMLRDEDDARTLPPA